ncbi:hypothetical protein [Draconibacterium halophilum]|uniref:Uncharacterized protein n=1 Tax=Draconibacterium halophilum TaxID=2706887 RepID=A0A6C0R8F0_9BACT|nr:hypothetical protein [Draconibacterium halophilum]QIA06439.1 hypothetical protein G0Q07_01255 [Draconibacterium halophilum]
MEATTQSTRVAAAAAPETQEFEPKLIGDPDFKRLDEINRAYEKLFGLTEQLKRELEECLKREKPFSFTEFLDFLTSDTQKWIYTKHIEYNNLNYPGINLEKLIELEAITIEGINDVLNSKAEFDKLKDTVKKLRFNYPLIKLWNEEDQRFAENQDFWEAVDKFCSRITKSEEQNRILKKMENLRDALNDLVEEGIIRPNNGIPELDHLKHWLLLPNRSNLTGFSVDRTLFQSFRMSKYEIKGIPQHWNTNPNLLLSNE